MSEQTVVLDHRVADFAAQVRARLADLTAEEREELAGDLEADLAELVAERGPGSLGDPAAYAVELRAAAGFGPEMARRGEPLGPRVDALLDAAHARWDGLVGGLPGRPWELVVALRPAWWVFRAWLAVSLVDLVLGDRSGIELSVVPTLAGWGAPLLVVAVVLSTLVGLRRTWPGTGGAGARVVLLLLNTFAVAVTPLCLASYTSAADVESWYAGESYVEQDGLTQDGSPISNIHAYDAAGTPLVGVQLVDQDGRPIQVSPEYYDEEDGASVELTPWRAGLQDVLNVFPLAERRTDNMTGEWLGEPALPEPPRASLPPVALDGVTASRQPTEAEVRAVQRLQEIREARRARQAQQARESAN